MKTKLILLSVVIITAFLLMYNATYSTNTVVSDKCKCENCKCTDCNNGGNCKCCTGGKCTMNGKCTMDGKCTMNDTCKMNTNCMQKAGMKCNMGDKKCPKMK